MKITRLALLLPFVALTACSMPPPPPGPIETVQGERLNIDARQILLIDHTSERAPVSPVVDAQFKPSLDGAIRKWAGDSLLAVGTGGQGSFTISNAYVTEQSIPIERNWYERKQASKYVGHAEISFEAQGQEGYGLATATVSREVSLPEHPSDEEKAQAYSRLINGMMQDLTRYLDEGIHTNLKDFVVTAPLLNVQPVSPVSTESPALKH